MSEPPELMKEVARWTEKAEHDFLAAEHAMELAKKGLTDIVCFHCQQCAEKYLKAFCAETSALRVLSCQFPVRSWRLTTDNCQLPTVEYRWGCDASRRSR